MVIEIVSFPIKIVVIVHCYVSLPEGSRKIIGLYGYWVIWVSVNEIPNYLDTNNRGSIIQLVLDLSSGS